MNYFISLMFVLILYLSLIGLLVYLIILIIKALKKYINNNQSEVKNNVRSSLSSRLKEERLKNNMTQEFVAETISVSRQAVSKWENGTSDPSTSNLFALAKLYNVSVEYLIKDIIE